MMKTLNLFVALFCTLIFSAAYSQKMAAPYLDHKSRECVLSYNSATGNSVLYYHKPSEKKFLVSSYQLPHGPIAHNEEWQGTPYLDHLGRECILVWDVHSGVSKIFYYKPSEKKFLVSSYQLPIAPLGSGDYHFSPYLDHLGRECVLVCNSTTGKSRIYFHKPSDNKFLESSYQLPENPLGKGPVSYAPYLDHLKRECVLVYNETNGNSKIYFHRPSDKKFLESSYQLPQGLSDSLGANIGMAPYLDHLGRECVIVYSRISGKSKIYYHKPSDNKFLISSYQLPTDPTAAKGLKEFAPYLDHLGRECVLVWNSKTGISKLFYHRPSDKKFLESSYQLPAIE
jgi:hypothetical protein